MRRSILSFALVAVCFALQSRGQTSPPRHDRGGPPLAGLLSGRKHAPPAPANAPSTPEITLDASNLGSPIVLTKGWRVGVTANQAAANPDFDDTKWAVRDAQEAIADVPDEDHSGPPPDEEKPPSNTDFKPPKGHQRPFVWFRIHLKLAPEHGPLSLLVELPVSQNASMFNASNGLGVDVFANGREVRPEGPHGDDPEHYQQISRLYSLNLNSSETNLVLAVRTIYIPVGYSAYTSFFAGRTFALGNRDDLDRHLEIWSTHALFERLPRIVVSILLMILALFILVLYFTQKGHIEYLWLALHELILAPLGFVELAGSTAHMDTLWYAATMLQLVLISAYFYFEFLIAFLALKKRWYIKLLRYSSPILLALGPLLLTVGHSTALAITLLFCGAFVIFWFLGWLVFIFLTLIIATVKRNFEAGLLLIPLVFDWWELRADIDGWHEPVERARVSFPADAAGRADSDSLCFHRRLDGNTGDRG